MLISKRTNFSTIVVVGSEKDECRSLQIKTKHVKRIKQYIAGASIVLVILMGLTVILSYQAVRHEKEKTAYTNEIAHLKTLLPDPQDTLRARNYIEHIERKLETINQYLKNRGLQSFSFEHIGGNADPVEALSPTEIYGLYNDRLTDILAGVTVTPMGYPGNAQITSRFGYRGDPLGSGRMEFHSGIDFKGRKGDPVKSTAAGNVIYAGWYQGYGNCIRIKHENNLETLYGHLSKIGVKIGQKVHVGEKIGEVGSTGRSTGSHLHYEVRKNGKPINPKTFIHF